jgi:UDP-N-acetylmuramate--alanine ligase
VSYIPPRGSIATLLVPDLEGASRVHMVGIGGAGMSAIARILMARGIEVSGSDLKRSRTTDELKSAGAVVFVGHAADQVQVQGRPDAVVVSSAIPERNPEVVSAREQEIPVWARAQVLAALMRGVRSIAVSGTHGKTTTTSMISVILARAGLDPTFVIGGDLNESGTGARHGSGNWFVAESDESDGSFLLMHPDVAVVTNVDDDHLDFYRDGSEIRAAFARFASQAARVVACGDDPGANEVVSSSTDPVTYGFGPHNDVRVVPGAPDGQWGAGARGTFHIDGERVQVSLRVAGLHNLLNATAAIIAARAAGVAPALAAEALQFFTGVRRRFEFRGVGRGAEFIDDYAHHPTEVRATLAATPSGYRRVLAVFQPHRFTRTAAMWRALGESLAHADVVVITDVYGAGEQPIPGVTGKLLVDSLAEAEPTKRVLYLPRRPDVVDFLAREVRHGDLVLTLGAGDITMVADETLERILRFT